MKAKTIFPLDVIREDLLYLNFSVLQNARLYRINIHNELFTWTLCNLNYNFTQTGTHKTTVSFYNQEIIRLACFVKKYMGDFPRSVKDPRWSKYLDLIEEKTA